MPACRPRSEHSTLRSRLLSRLRACRNPHAACTISILYEVLARLGDGLWEPSKREEESQTFEDKKYAVEQEPRVLDAVRMREAQCR